MQQLTEFQFEECKRQFTELGERALYLNHYQLAAETHIRDAIIWKTFLTDPRIADYISLFLRPIKCRTEICTKCSTCRNRTN